MSFFKQLRLLTHHKLLLRRRQPGILLLELFWPVIVFLSVFIVRLQFLPEQKPTCYYNAKALPSAGPVDFIQSLVCSVDNPCVDASGYREVPTYPNARIHKLVEQLSPLLTDKNVTGAISELPKGIRLIAVIVDTLSQPEVKGLLDNGLPISETLRDDGGQARVRRFVLEALQTKLPDDQAALVTDYLVSSSLKLVGLSSYSRRIHEDDGLSGRALLCDTNKLGQVLLLSNQSALGLVSDALCSLDVELGNHLLRMLQEEVDFSKIVKRFTDVMNAVGLPLDPEFEQMALLMQPLPAETPVVTDDKGLLLPVDSTETYINYDEDRRETYAKPNDHFNANEEIRIETHEVGNLDTPEQLDGDLLMVESDPKNVMVKQQQQQQQVQPGSSAETIVRTTVSVAAALTASNNRTGRRLRQGRQFGSHDPTLPFDTHPDTGSSLIADFESFDFVKLVRQGVLLKAGLAGDDIPRALEALKEAARAMPYVKGFVTNFTKSMNLEEELSHIDLRGDGIDLLGTPQASEITAKLMCGQPVRVLTDEFELFKAAKGMKKAQINEAELKSLPSQFCRNGYTQIMSKMSGGPVVWSFLKPVLTGKILYAPKNRLTEQIMSHMNGTFTFMNEFKLILEAWTSTITSLEAFYKRHNINSRVQSIQPLLVEFLGNQVEGLFNDMDAQRTLERLANSGGVLGLVQLVGSVAQCFELERFIGFDTEIELEEAAKRYTKAHELIAGIVFLNVNDNEQENAPLPKKIHYKIRADIDFVPTTKMLKERMWEPGPRANYLKDLGYQRGFVQVQEMIDRAITMIHINQSELTIAPAVHLQQMPYLCYQEDRFGLYIRALTPVVATVAWIFLIAFMIRERVLERELHLEEVLRVMGLRSSVAWITWFGISIVVMAFGSACAVGILSVAQLIPYSSLLIIYLYFLAFCFSIIMFCYMMSSFFKTSTIAALSGIVAYLASYLPFMVAITLEYDMTFWHKIGTCLSMSTSFCFGMMYMSRYEAQGAGVQWSNIWQSPMADDPMNFATAGIIMLVDGVIYFLIGWYISNVFPPGNNGHSEPWYFFILPRYWGLGRRRSHGRNLPPHAHMNGLHLNGKSSSKYCLENGYLEASWQRRPGMSLHNLDVIYNKGRKDEHKAVTDLSLELKEGQITTLLGRNGAGKTTTISVLTGQLPPTHGSVFVYGHAVPEEFSEARKLLGYCPQYNTLFKDLTIREHLIFFSTLKGLLSSREIPEDTDRLLHNIGLWKIQHELVKNLSGGLQRRLCVALAFVGGSKLIILDEPTSSVDPVARRSIWDLIVEQKQSRTVLLTTHHMDEADVLSDQCAVIHRGKLLCTGSPLLLRSKYGCGYQLSVSRQGIDESGELGDSDSGRASNEFPDEANDSEKLLSFTKCLIPNATLVEEYASETILSLPHQSPDGNPHDYATFFRCLDSNLHALGYGSYGLTSTTLEEVFLTLCNLEEENNMSVEKAKLNVSRKISNPLKDPDAPVNDKCSEIRKQWDQEFNRFDWSSPSLVDGFPLKFKQLWALLAKRAYHATRDWRSLFCNLFMPCMFIALAMAMTLIKPHFAPDPILPLTPVIYGRGATTFLAMTNQSSAPLSMSIAEQLLHAQHQEPNCGRPREGWTVAKCPIIRGVKHADDVILPPYLRSLSGPEWQGGHEAFCDCDNSAINGTAEAINAIDRYAETLPEVKATGIGYLYELGQANVSDYLLRTFTKFNDKRFGGFTLHQTNDNKSVAKVWFDNNGFHAMAAYLSAFDEALMKSNIKAAGLNPEEYSITTYSHPFHIRSSQIGDQSLMQRAGDAGIALIILVGFIFIPTSFVFYLVRERTEEEKQLQKIFGVGPLLYWFSAVVWDLLTVIVAVFLSGLIIYSFQMPIYVSRLNLPGVLVLLFLFGWAMTSVVYVMEKLFNEPSIAFMVLYCIALFAGIMTMVMRLLIDVFQLLTVSPAFKTAFENIALVFPPYALMSGLVDITRNQLFTEIFTLFDQDVYVSPFVLLQSHYMTLAIEGAVFFTLNLIIELCSNWCLATKARTSTSPYVNEDNDVAEERRRVTQESSRFDVLRVVNVSKIFKGMFGKRMAVDHVSFAVPRGECFGLLGVNGAGKTTLFRMLTGQLKPSAGETIINRMNISKLLSSSCQFLGYCPQADALDSVLSPREHLTIYCEMRGIPSLHVKRVVADSLTKFQLNHHADMPVQCLSRGTKRKLCLAIAMVGSPQIVLLDEPTSGMDPMSRRCLWSNIQTAVRDRRSVLLTSHSMEECDILCSRLAIMVNGRFRCIGSPQYLKHKFGAGYTIAMRLSEGSSNWNEAVSLMKQSFPSCILRAHHHNMLEFSLPTNDVPLSNIFSSLQEAKTLLQLQDFSVSQTTLDQVFVGFANQQVNDFQRDNAAEPQAPTQGYTNLGFVSSTTNLSTKPASQPPPKTPSAKETTKVSSPPQPQSQPAPQPSASKQREMFVRSPPVKMKQQLHLPPPAPIPVMPMLVRMPIEPRPVALVRAKSHAHKLERRGPKAMKSNSSVGQHYHHWKAIHQAHQQTHQQAHQQARHQPPPPHHLHHHAHLPFAQYPLNQKTTRF